jgi:polyphosphate kinase
VEVITPIENRQLHPRVCSLLETCLADNRQAWDLHSDGTYVQRKPGANPVVSTHERLLQNSWGLIALPSSNGEGAKEKTATERAVSAQLSSL